MAVDDTLRDRILDATEAVVRRHGPAKANVVDVAGELGMSPGNVYRFFSSKKELLAATAARWIERLEAPMRAIADDHGRSAEARLTAWFDTLRKNKRKKLIDEPELFRAYVELVKEHRDAVADHVKDLLGQIERIIGDGKSAGEFPKSLDAKTAARAFLHATTAFHHPAMVLQHPAPTEAEARAVIRMVIAGMRAG